MRTFTRYAVAILLLGMVGVLPTSAVFAFAPGGDTESSALIGILESIKGVFGQAETLTAAGSEVAGTGETSSGTWQDTAGKVWGAVKDFFSDRSARELLLETLKLFLKVIVNIFVIIANLLSKILAAV